MIYPRPHCIRTGIRIQEFLPHWRILSLCSLKTQGMCIKCLLASITENKVERRQSSLSMRTEKEGLLTVELRWVIWEHKLAAIKGSSCSSIPIGIGLPQVQCPRVLLLRQCDSNIPLPHLHNHTNAFYWLPGLWWFKKKKKKKIFHGESCWAPSVLPSLLRYFEMQVCRRSGRKNTYGAQRSFWWTPLWTLSSRTASFCLGRGRFH